MQGQRPKRARHARRSMTAAAVVVTLVLVVGSFGATAVYVDVSKAGDATQRAQEAAKRQVEQAKQGADCAGDYVRSTVGPTAHLRTVRPAPECSDDDLPPADPDRWTSKALAKGCHAYDDAVETVGSAGLPDVRYVEDPVAEAAGTAAGLAPDCPRDPEPHWV